MVSDFCIYLYCPIECERWANRAAPVAITETLRPVDISRKNTLAKGIHRCAGASFVSGISWQGWVAPSPTPSESLDWRGFCKNGLQHLESQGLRGRNLDNKELAPFFGAAACT